MHTSSMDIEHLKKLIERKVKHTYLDKYIQKPIINEQKLFIVASIMNNAIIPAYQKKQYIITTMLVQMALDTHDLVPKTNELDSKQSARISKQLTVLAGDYYSGLYYFLLSEIDDYAMIRTLASAIKEINEYKMKMYYREIENFHEFIYTVKKIESLLFSYVAEHVQESTMKNVLEEWLLTSKLIQEKKKIQFKNASPLFDIWIEQTEDSTYSSILGKIEHIIQKNTLQLEDSLTPLAMHETAYKTVLNDLLYKNTSDVEEG